MHLPYSQTLSDFRVFQNINFTFYYYSTKSIKFDRKLQRFHARRRSHVHPDQLLRVGQEREGRGGGRRDRRDSQPERKSSAKSGATQGLVENFCLELSISLY